VRRAAAALALLLVACGHAAVRDPAPPAAVVPAARPAPVSPVVTELEPFDPAELDEDPTFALGWACPLAVPGATVTVNDTPRGLAMVFTGGDVELLRRRVRELAIYLMMLLDDGDEPAFAARGLPPEDAPVVVTIAAEDVADGARLVVEADDPESAAILRRALRRMVQDMRDTDGCPYDR
jgi:hypothetical protein